MTTHEGARIRSLDWPLPPGRTKALLVFPRFGPLSFWGLQAMCALYGARCPAPPLGLITLAALLPADWEVRLVDRNARELSDRDIDWADIVMTGGMLPQRPDALSVIRRAQGRGKPVAVGGPDVMSSPEVYGEAEFRVVGEAEGLLPQFVDAWRRGAERGTFTAEKFSADLGTSPVPRFDLLRFADYMFVGVQFSRGCPFNCEFCDIIELYGRVPRTKSADQMLRELQSLHDAGYRGHVDFVDDNLVGNKRALKRFLPALIAWQQQRGYPFQFSTEASLNLADDPELLALMSAAGFFVVFTGIESPDTETLIQARKKQNTRRSLADSVHRINAAGMFVIAGFIVGFDTERSRVVEGMVDCIEGTSIAVCMVGLLTALPNTQLSRRLEREGRLRPLEIPDGTAEAGDQCTAGLNFLTKRPRVDILADFRDVLRAIYQPEAYFSRVVAAGRRLRRPRLNRRLHPPTLAKVARAFMRLTWEMTIRHPDWRGPFWRAVWLCLRHNPSAMELVLIQTAFYLHLGPFSGRVIAVLDRLIAEAAATDKTLVGHVKATESATKPERGVA
jgi:radical SAM superfamily enzyme YgiQ (UPF0313 family)